MIFAAGRKFEAELMRIGPTPRLAEWRRRGRLLRVSADAVAAAEGEISESAVESDDSHLLAVAVAGGARVLCAADAALKADFANRAVLPGLPDGPRRTFPHQAARAKQKKFLDRRECPGPCS